MHSQFEPVLVTVIGIAGAIACACIGFLTMALIFVLVAIGGAWEYRSTRDFNDEQAREGFDGSGVSVNPSNLSRD
jgi:uncharacterized membrane protein